MRSKNDQHPTKATTMRNPNIKVQTTVGFILDAEHCKSLAGFQTSNLTNTSTTTGPVLQGSSISAVNRELHRHVQNEYHMTYSRLRD